MSLFPQAQFPLLGALLCTFFSYLRRERTSTLAVTIKISFKRFPSSFHGAPAQYSTVQQYNFFPALRLATGAAAAAERWSGGAERSQTSFFLMFVREGGRGGGAPSLPRCGNRGAEPPSPPLSAPPVIKRTCTPSPRSLGWDSPIWRRGKKVAFFGFLREMLCALCSTRGFFSRSSANAVPGS